MVTSPEKFIKVLERAIEDLTVYTNKIPGKDWAKMLKFSDFLEQEVIEHESGTGEKEERNRFYQRSAAYIGIVQILFYITFHQFRLDNGINKDPELAPLSSSNGIPSRVQELLLEIPHHDLNFKTIYGENRIILEKLDADAAPVINAIINRFEGLSAGYVIENDLIGQIFQRLMPPEIRKKHAAYYSLRKAAELLCNLSITSKNEVIFDPACGSGTLLLHAYQRLKELGLTRHERILQHIYGSDISDVASMMSTLNLAIQDPRNWITQVNIYSHDILDLVGSGIERFFPVKLATVDGQQKSVQNKLPLIDVLLGNPPFSRCMRVSERYRKRLSALSLVTKYKFKPNFKALGLYSFFLLIGPTLVKKNGGKIAFILPLGAINSEAMIEIWKILHKEDFGIKFLIMASMQDKAFSDSTGQEIMVILEKAFKDPAKIIRLKGHLIDKDISALIASITDINDLAGQNEDFSYVVWDQATIQDKTCMEWNVSSNSFIESYYAKFVPIDELSASISIISQNQSRPADYWFIPNKYWSIESENEDTIKIVPTSRNTLITSSKNPDQAIILPRNGFVYCLERTISKYNEHPAILPSGIHHTLFIVDENREEFTQYRSWGQKAHANGMFSSGSHSHSSIALNMIGILQKISFTGSKTLALRFSEPLMGAGVIMFGFYGEDETIIDLLFAYLTSSLFLLDALTKARTRAGDFARIHKVDIEKLYKFPNFKEIAENQEITGTLIERSRSYNSERSLNARPIFIKKIIVARSNPADLLRKLDEAWFTVLNLPLTALDQLYQEILTSLDQYVKKDNVTIKKSSNKNQTKEGGK